MFRIEELLAALDQLADRATEAESDHAEAVRTGPREHREQVAVCSPLVLS